MLLSGTAVLSVVVVLTCGSVSPADVKMLLKTKEKVPPKQQEALCTSQEALQEADTTKVTSSPVTVRRNKKRRSAKLHQRRTEYMETDADGEESGSEPEPEPDTHSQPDSADSDLESSEVGSESETPEPQSGYDKLKLFIQKRHRRIHAEKKPFGCSVCGKTLVNKVTLKRHMRNHRLVKPFGCSVCDKTFVAKGSVKRHMKVHTGEKPFSCSVCRKRLESRRALRRHMRIHRLGERFSCSICDKTFVGKGSVSRHMKLHTGEKPFSCSFCGKSFIQKVHLQSHMKIHARWKPSSVCGDGFNEKPRPTNHTAEDTGEKPFGCSVCGRRYAWKGNLKRHKNACQASEPGRHLPPVSDDETSDSSDSESPIGEAPPGSDVMRKRGRFSESSEPETEDSEDMDGSH